MSKSKSDQPDSVEGSKSTQEEFAARFLLRALQDLRLADDTITVSDLQTFAGTLIKEMDLMIGSEKFLRRVFDDMNQFDFYYMGDHARNADHLSEKILQAQQNLAKIDREIPF